MRFPAHLSPPQKDLLIPDALEGMRVLSLAVVGKKTSAAAERSNYLNDVMNLITANCTFSQVSLSYKPVFHFHCCKRCKTLMGIVTTHHNMTLINLKLSCWILCSVIEKKSLHVEASSSK